MCSIEFPKLDGKAVEILIGNDVPETHWVFEQRCGRRKQPYAVRTPLGCTLIGPLGQTSTSEAQVNLVCGGQEMLSNQFKRVYDAEFSEFLSLHFLLSVILSAKTMLQELCRQDYGWDEQIPKVKLLRWRTWVGNLSNLEQITWPRGFKPKGFVDLTDIQLHHFSDASEVGTAQLPIFVLKIMLATFIAPWCSRNPE